MRTQAAVAAIALSLIGCGGGGVHLVVAMLLDPLRSTRWSGSG